MDGVSIAVFGPSDGAVAFSLSTGKVLSDDTLFLATSDFQLNENESTIVYSRINSSKKNSHIRVCIYRQINEPNLRRLGHSFGASIDFSDQLPDPELILKTLRELTVVLEEGCCKNGSFCNTTSFNHFVDKFLLPNYIGITESLLGNRPEKNPVPYQRINDKKFFHLSNDENLNSDTTELLNWFAFKPGGIFCRSLVVASKLAGTPGPSYSPLENIAIIDEEATNWLMADNLQLRNQLEILNRDLTFNTGALTKRKDEIVKLENELSIANNKINNFSKTHKNDRINERLFSQLEPIRRNLSAKPSNFSNTSKVERQPESRKLAESKEEETRKGFKYWSEVICFSLVLVIIFGFVAFFFLKYL